VANVIPHLADELGCPEVSSLLRIQEWVAVNSELRTTPSITEQAKDAMESFTFRQRKLGTAL
jgi:hypothetical protein